MVIHDSQKRRGGGTAGTSDVVVVQLWTLTVHGAEWYKQLVTIAAESGAALRDCPGYRRLWTAATVSGFGSYVTNLAIGVLIVLNLHGGATEVGLVNAARWFPYMLFGLVAGVLVDRARRRPLLVVTDLGRGILLLAVPVLAMTHRLNVVWLMALMANRPVPA